MLKMSPLISESACSQVGQTCYSDCQVHFKLLAEQTGCRSPSAVLVQSGHKEAKGSHSLWHTAESRSLLHLWSGSPQPLWWPYLGGLAWWTGDEGTAQAREDVRTNLRHLNCPEPRHSSSSSQRSFRHMSCPWWGGTVHVSFGCCC